MRVRKWIAAARSGAALIVLAATGGCDGGGGFGTGLDDGSSSDAVTSCQESGDYPEDTYAWAPGMTVPPSDFDGEPQNLDLQRVYCQHQTIRSLVFILGAPG